MVHQRAWHKQQNNTRQLLAHSDRKGRRGWVWGGGNYCERGVCVGGKIIERLCMERPGRFGEGQHHRPALCLSGSVGFCTRWTNHCGSMWEQCGTADVCVCVHACVHLFGSVWASVSRCRGLPVAAAAKEPHDLPGGLILPLGEQTSSVWMAKTIEFRVWQFVLWYLLSVLPFQYAR